MFYSVTNYSTDLMTSTYYLGQSNLKAFVMLNCEDLEFSWEGVSVASCQISMSRHGYKCCCNSAIQFSICPRLHMFDKDPGLNTSEYGFQK